MVNLQQVIKLKMKKKYLTRIFSTAKNPKFTILAT